MVTSDASGLALMSIDGWKSGEAKASTFSLGAAATSHRMRSGSSSLQAVIASVKATAISSSLAVFLIDANYFEWFV